MHKYIFVHWNTPQFTSLIPCLVRCEEGRELTACEVYTFVHTINSNCVCMCVPHAFQHSLSHSLNCALVSFVHMCLIVHTTSMELPSFVVMYASCVFTAHSLCRQQSVIMSDDVIEGEEGDAPVISERVQVHTSMLHTKISSYHLVH